MKAECEVCGGELVKSGEFFVCEDCGCKYTVADIRKQLNIGSGRQTSNDRSIGMQINSRDAGGKCQTISSGRNTNRIDEKPCIESNMTASGRNAAIGNQYSAENKSRTGGDRRINDHAVDINSSRSNNMAAHSTRSVVEDYIDSIRSAVRRDSYDEVLKLSDKILGIEADNYQGWFYKGIGLLWRLNSATPETLKEPCSAVSNALTYCPAEDKPELEKKIVRSLQDFTEEYIYRALNKYGNTLSDEASDEVFTAYQLFLYLSRENVDRNFGIRADFDEYYMSAWENITDTLSDIWKNQLHDPAEKLRADTEAKRDFLRELIGSFVKAQSGPAQVYLLDEKFQDPEHYRKRRIRVLNRLADMCDYCIDNGGWLKSYCDEMRSVSSGPERALAAALGQAKTDSVSVNAADGDEGAASGGSNSADAGSSMAYDSDDIDAVLDGDTDDEEGLLYLIMDDHKI